MEHHLEVEDFWDIYSLDKFLLYFSYCLDTVLGTGYSMDMVDILALISIVLEEKTQTVTNEWMKWRVF